MYHDAADDCNEIISCSILSLQQNKSFMNKIVLFILLIISSCCTSMEKKNVARTNLLSIQLREKQGLSKVEIKKVVIPVNGKAEYH